MHFFELVGKYSQQQKYDERAHTFTTFFPFPCARTRIHLLTDWTNSFLNDGELSIIYLLCWTDEFIAVCLSFPTRNSNNNSCIANTITGTQKWILQRLALPAILFACRSACTLKTTANVIFQALRSAARMHSGLLLHSTSVHVSMFYYARLCVRVTHKNLTAQTSIACV